jgi:hypothetical protein
LANLDDCAIRNHLSALSTLNGGFFYFRCFLGVLRLRVFLDLFFSACKPGFHLLLALFADLLLLFLVIKVADVVFEIKQAFVANLKSPGSLL